MHLPDLPRTELSTKLRRRRARFVQQAPFAEKHILRQNVRDTDPPETAEWQITPGTSGRPHIQGAMQTGRAPARGKRPCQEIRHEKKSSSNIRGGTQ